jgi:flagellar protein FlaJ
MDISITFNAISLKLFNNIAKCIVKSMKLDEKILKSYNSITPEVLVSRTLLISILSLPITLFSINLYLEYNIPFILLLVPIPALIFIIGISTPALNISNRKAAIEDELPFIIGYISILSKGGITLPFALERISSNELLPASSKEARNLFLEINMLGKDPISALDKLARNNPNNNFADFMGGYVNTLKSRGDVNNYLLAKLRDVYTMRSLRQKSLINLTGNLAEAYMGIVVVLGLSLIVMFSSQGLVSGSGNMIASDGNSSLSFLLFSGVLVPIISVAFIGILHTSQPKEPYQYSKPYKIFISFIPLFILIILLPYLWDYIPFEIKYNIIDTLGAIVSILFDNLNYFLSIIHNLLNNIIYIEQLYIPESLYLSIIESIEIIKIADATTFNNIFPIDMRISIGLISISIIPAILDIKHAREKRLIESKLPMFLRELVEINKSSISIEYALEQVMDRDYGVLTKHIRYLYSQISWGFPIYKILDRFTKNLKSWLSKIIAYILLEVMSIGGNNSESLTLLAEFVERNERLDNEKRSSLRLYIFMPYIGSIISILTLTMMLQVFTQEGGSLSMNNEDKSIFLAGSIIQSFSAGMVAGKMGEESVSAGFKHSLILTILNMVIIIISPLLGVLFSF